MAKQLVFVFARAPRYGAVKTRLARDIGALATLRFYRFVLARLVRRLKNDRRFEIVLAVTPDSAVREQGLWPSGVRVVGQGPGELGPRMMRVLRSAGVGPAVIVGSDIPGVTASHIARAFTELGRKQYVLGPARDGGYWLIGARHPPQIREHSLSGVRWSSAFALSDTAARLGDVAVLADVLDDVDDGTAYVRMRRHASTSRVTSPSFW